VTGPTPSPILAMRRRQRRSGEPFMVAVLAEQLILEAGTELHLRRMDDGKLQTPEFVLQVIPLRKPLTDKARDQAATDRLDGTAIRTDQRDAGAEPAPF
jgi:hypothetical protein